MQNPIASRLLAELDPLPYPARMRLLAARTSEFDANATLDGVLDAFATADAYQRRLALAMAKIARRGPRLIAALDDPLYRLRVQALRACLGIGSAAADAAVLTTLSDAPVDWRKSLARAIGAAGRTDLADLLVTTERARLGDVDAARLLASCSTDVAAATLPELIHAVPNPAKVGARHPALVLEFARRELATLPPGARESWWGSFGLFLAPAAELLPDRVIALLEQFPVPSGLPWHILKHVPALVRTDATAVLRLLSGASDPLLAHRWRSLSRSVRRVLTELPAPERDLVGRALYHQPGDFARMLRDLPPSERSAFFDAVLADRDAATAVVDVAVLDALPRARRHAEVRRMLKLDALVSRPEQRLALTARLPWGEALAELRAAVRRPDAQERAAAYPLLVRCAAASGEPAAVTALLTGELDRLRNEQDPVRLAAVTALAAVPPELFEPCDAVAGALLQTAIDATEARDISAATRAALRRLACRVLTCHVGAVDGDGAVLVDWSLIVLAELAGTVGRLDLGRLDRELRRGLEDVLYRVLEPWIERGIKRADHGLALELARSLGRRAWSVPALQEKLEHAVRHGTTTTARRAIDLWLGDPAHRTERVARLVAWDPSTAVVFRVARALSLTRTDLLDPYLERRVVKGRFIADGAVWLPAFEAGARWLPRQLAAYADLLGQIAADRGAKVEARVSAVRRLGALPGEGHRTILGYLDAAEVPLAEAALGALAWSEDPAAALPVLLGYAGSDRARVAVYAATRAARYARASAAAAALRDVALSPSAKVTSRKEVLRIAADLELPGLVDLLVEAWRLPGQHRDVKAAAVSRLAACLHDPRVLPLLREAVESDPAAAATILRIPPYALREHHRAAYGELIAAACDLADPKVSVAAVTAAPRWYRWTDAVADAVCAAVAEPDRRGERTAPPAALLLLLRQGMPLTRVTAVLQQLLAADEADAGDPTDGARDRPARRRLIAVLRALDQTRGRLDGRQEILHAAAAVLAGHVGYVAETAALTAAAVDLAAAPADLTA